MVCGFADADPATITLTHGNGYSVESTQPYNRVLLVVPWRWIQGSGSSFQTNAYNGNPPEAGLWAVPSGMSLSAVQATPATYQLAGLDTVLNEIKPDFNSISFKVQLLGSGHWQVAVDINNDGVADVVTDDAQTGNRISPFTAMTERSGLLLSSRAAMGSRTGTVGRTSFGLSYRVSPSAPESLQNRRPFTVNLRQIVKSSPTVIDGQAWSTAFTTTASASTLGAYPVAVTPVTGTAQWFIDLPLNAVTSTPITFAQSGSPLPTTITGSVWWEAIDMYHNEAITIRRGDSVKLQCMATCGRETVKIDANGDGVIDWIGTDADAFVYQYTTSGIHTAVAYNGAGTAIGSAQITVTVVNLDGPIACQVGFEREKGVEVDLQLTNNIFFTSSDPTVMTVSVKQTTPYGVRLFIKALKLGAANLEARSGSTSGALLAVQPVDIFTFINTGAQGVLKDADGSGIAMLYMTPFVPGLSLHLDMFSGLCSFDAAGARSVIYNPSAWETGIDDSTGLSYGIIYQKIYVPLGADSFCYKARLDQHSKYGTFVSLDNASNGEAYQAEMRDTPAMVTFTTEATKDYKGTFVIRAVDKAGNPKSPHREITWEYITGTVGHQPLRDTDITQYVPNNPPARRNDDLVTALAFPAALAEQPVPKTFRVYPPRVIGNVEYKYQVEYFAKLKAGLPPKLESKGKVKLFTTKVKFATLAISSPRDYIAVVYTETGAGALVPNVDKITINVTKGKAVTSSWKFIGTVPNDLNVTGTETMATVAANAALVTPGGPYTVEATSDADPEEKATLTVGVGAASWEAFRADGEGPVVLAAASTGKDWLVLTGGPFQRARIKLRGSKAVFQVAVKDGSQIVASPSNLTAFDGLDEVTFSGGVANRKFVRGVFLKTGSGSASVEYPNTTTEGLNIRIYTPAVRTVKPTYVYFMKDGVKIYYESGNATRPVARIAGADIAYINQVGYSFSEVAGDEIEFDNPAAKAAIAAGTEYRWTDSMQNQAASGVSLTANHNIIILGLVDTGTTIALSDTPGRKIYGPIFSERALAHEIGHNLGIGPHTDNTVMSAQAGPQNTNDFNEAQLDAMRPVP